MRIHRFFIGDELKLRDDFWVHDEALLWQWNKVLRFKAGQKVNLFNDGQEDRLYEITEISKSEAHLKMIADRELVLPKRHIYLFWSLLKKDNNEFVLQKCTELGVSNFVPIISERSVKTSFNMTRAEKIVIEASEQCGRSNIPKIREPIHLQKAVEQYAGSLNFVICEQGSETDLEVGDKQKYGLLVGPEGGWSEAEKELFRKNNFTHLAISNHTLRAETASVVAVSKIL